MNLFSLFGCNQYPTDKLKVTCVENTFFDIASTFFPVLASELFLAFIVFLCFKCRTRNNQIPADNLEENINLIELSGFRI